MITPIFCSSFFSFRPWRLGAPWRVLASLFIVAPCGAQSSRFALVYCLLAFGISCKQKTDYTKEISRLDSAEIILNESGKILLSADTNSFRVSYNTAAGNLHTIMEKLAKDTVKKKMAMFLSDAYQQSGNIVNLLDNKKYLEQAMSETKQRINNLKHDLSENLIENNKAEEYVVNEIISSEKIHHLVTHSVEQAKSSVIKLDSLKLQLIAMADSLNQQKTK